MPLRTWLHARPRKSPEVQWRALQAHAPGFVHDLTAVEARIADLADGSRTVEQIVADLEASFGARGLQGDVLAFLDMARGKQWVQD